MVRSVFLPFLLLSLSLVACTPAISPAWKNPADGSSPSMSDTSDCRAEVRRMAELRYPSRPVPRGSGSSTEPFYRQEDPDRFPAEVRFYEACLERKGFRRT